MTETALPRGVDNMMSGESLLPSQFFDSIAPDRLDMPEKRLQLAILCDAVQVLFMRAKKDSPRLVRARRHAIDWIIGNSELVWPFSFSEICDSLAIDARTLRRTLLTKYRMGITIAGITRKAPNQPVLLANRRSGGGGRERRSAGVSGGCAPVAASVA